MIFYKFISLNTYTHKPSFYIILYKWTSISKILPPLIPIYKLCWHLSTRWMLTNVRHQPKWISKNLIKIMVIFKYWIIAKRIPKPLRPKTQRNCHRNLLMALWIILQMNNYTKAISRDSCLNLTPLLAKSLIQRNYWSSLKWSRSNDRYKIRLTTHQLLKYWDLKFKIKYRTSFHRHPKDWTSANLRTSRRSSTKWCKR